MRVLYLVYWGALEPLGQSLVLPTVKLLAKQGVDLTLVTFEKRTDLERKEDFSSTEEELRLRGINWIALRYNKKPKLLAKAFDFCQAWLQGLTARGIEKVDLVHSRTYLGGVMGLPLARLLRARFIYHNEGFYPDEQVDAGVWQAGSITHRTAKFLERQLYMAADGIITLSHRGRQTIGSISAVQRKRTPIITVPSCVDLEHFRLRPRCFPNTETTLRIVYVGSVGGRYMLDRIGRFVVLLGKIRKVHLQIYTRTEPSVVHKMLEDKCLSEEDYSVCSVPYRAMPEALIRHHVGIHFLACGLSEHGGSPTKIGEYWACGLPVVATPNMGDTDSIIRKYRVGVIVENHADSYYLQVAEQLSDLLDDPNLAARCRKAAEQYYGIANACREQVHLYTRLLRGR